MKVLVFDDKMFFGKNGVMVSVEGDHSVVADALMFEVDPAKAVTAEPDQYSTNEDLNEFREALGLAKVDLPEDEEEEEEEEEEEDDEEENEEDDGK